MKIKLLRRIRKQYSIVYYPFEKYYSVEYDTKGTLRDIHGWCYNNLLKRFDTLEEAKKALLHEFKKKYFKHSRKYKLKQVKHKVWYR